MIENTGNLLRRWPSLTIWIVALYRWDTELKYRGISHCQGINWELKEPTNTKLQLSRDNHSSQLCSNILPLTTAANLLYHANLMAGSTESFRRPTSTNDLCHRLSLAGQPSTQNVVGRQPTARSAKDLKA
jgi:hypothetical protein